jgi:Sap, sulfolipid-1-addressing protein
VSQIFLLSLTAALNPTLLAATTVMLVLPSPKRLLLGYLIGATMTSVTLGVVIVFTLSGSSSTTSTAQHTLNPAVDIVLGGLILVIGFVVGTGRDTRRRARSERKRAASVNQAPPRWKQALSGGSARTTFVVGALLTLPGASYLAALTLVAKQDLPTVGTVLTVVAFNVVMLMLLEIPLIGFAISPDTTAARVQRFSDWLSRNGGRIAVVAALVIGFALVVRGTAELIA